MTDDDIIKAYENCCNGVLGRCVKCPVKPYGKKTCIDELHRLIFDLIKRLKEQNKEFSEKIIMQMGLIEYQKGVIENVKRDAAELQKEKDNNH